MSITIGVGVQNTGYTNTPKKTENTKATTDTKSTAAVQTTSASVNPNVVQTNATGDTLEVSNQATNRTNNQTTNQTTNENTNKTEKKQVDEKELAKLMAEAERDAKQFMNFMDKVLGNQGKQDAISKFNGNNAAYDDLDSMQAAVGDLQKGLANGTLKVSQEDIDKAKELTSEDGYYGVKKTSARIVDFAKAISGGDPEKAEMLREAAQKGFEQAAELWGGMENAPQITKDTYDAVMKGFDEWVGGGAAATETTSATA